MSAVVRPFTFGGSNRPQNGSMARFQYTYSDKEPDRAAAALRSNHPALSEARTLFPTRVLDPVGATHVLISGHNNAKLGAFVTKGPWAGMAIYTLTLEERATCPKSCDLWAECYGNAMPLSKRWRHGPDLIAALDRELRAKAQANRKGFVVRLHVLGDFPDMEYVDAWQRWMVQIAELRVFGYTHHPADSDIGKALARTNSVHPDRFAIRFSVAPGADIGPMQATTIWRKARGEIAEGVVCPSASGDTETCGTCGLCWSQSAADKRIVFLGHGMGKRGRKPGVQHGRPRAAGESAENFSTDSAFLAVLDRHISDMERRLTAARTLRASYGA